MSEQMNFTEENKKTVISFIAGLVIGGLLVYIFALPSVDNTVEDSNDRDDESELVVEDETEEDEEAEEDEDVNTSPTPVTSTSVAPVIRDGEVTVENQSAGSRVELDDVTFPSDEGWIGVRDYENGQLTGLLGVSRFSATEGLYPTGINLLRSTEAGKTYAVVFYQDNGDQVFNLATDSQIQTDIATFVAR